MDINEMYKTAVNDAAGLTRELDDINKNLDIIGSEQKNIVVKKIQGKLYYYVQWNEQGKTMNRSLGRVASGVCAETETEIELRRDLLNRRREVLFMLEHINKNIVSLKKEISQRDIVDDYSFEVFWKDELTARVHVIRDKVKVSRYCIHPLKQIFPGNRITRYQLNQIMAMRYFEKGRPDIGEKLKALGVEEYNPYEIIKRTHGVSYNDYIWFRFPKEKLRAADVLVRR